MARVPEGVLKSWRDGNRIEAADYVREQEVFRQAINDTQDQVDALTQRPSGLGKAEADLTYVTKDEMAQIDSNSIVPTFVNGQLVKVEEKDGETVKSSSTLTYNQDGTVNTVTDTINGKTVVTTLNYVNGEFHSTSKAVL